MKKIILFASALAGLFLAASCQHENLEPEVAQVVTYTVQVPGALGTKAIGVNVDAVTELVYEVYRTEALTADDYDAAEVKLYQKTAPISNGTATVDLELVNNQNFRVLFWAQVPNNGVYTTTDLKDVTLKQTLAANAENYAAFAGSDYIKYGDQLVGRTITLVRPVSQLNIATTSESLVLGENGTQQTTVAFENTAVTVDGLSTSYNVAEGIAATDEAKFTYAAQPVGLSEKTLSVNGISYTYVAMNYVGFAQNTGDNVKVSYTIKTDKVGVIENTIDNVPVKPNYRTNIVGNLITSMSDYTITLDGEWAGDTDGYEIWDGETLTAPTTNAAGEYVVSKPSEWAYLANQQNPMTKADPVPVVVNLTSDLDFGGNALTALAVVRNNSLTVKGNGYTIKNAKMVSGNEDNGTPCASLFVNLPSSELIVSDLNVKNLNVVVDQDPEHGYAAVLVAYAEGKVTLNDIKVSNSTVYGTHSIGTAVGFLAGTSSVEIKNFAADGIKLSNADVAGESGSMGGFVGRVAGTLEADNVKVSNSTIEAYVATASEQKRSIAKFIGNFVGGGNVNVTGASVENVTIVAKNELAEIQQCLYTEYLGGWRGNGGSVLINGIEITKDQTNDDITIDTQEEFEAAISNAADGAVIPVSGEITTNSLSSGKNITIVGMSEDAAINASTQSNYISAEGSDITFKNITFKFPLDPNHAASGINADGGNLVFENCKFEGSAVISEGVVVYNDCEFNNVDGKYAAFVYAGNVIYNNCYFKAKNRAVKVYGDMTGLKVTYNDCTFEALEANKAAVEFDTSNTCKNGNILNDYNEVTINNATVINMGQAEHWGTEVFNLEGGYGTSGIVTVDGVTYAKAAYKGAFDVAAQKNSKSIEIRLTAEVDLGNIGTAPAYGGVATESFTINGTNKNGADLFTPNTLKYSDTYRTYFTMENPSAKLVIKDAKMNYSSTNMGHFHNYAPKFCCPVELSAVVFDNAICVSGVKAVLYNVTINESMADHYALWIASGSDVTLENCQINATASTGRAIKIADEDAAEEMTNLSLRDVVVKSGKKAAVLVSTAYGAEINVESINIDDVVADKVNAVWVDEDYASYFDSVVVTGANKRQE